MNRVLLAPSGVSPGNKRQFSGYISVRVVEISPEIGVVVAVVNASKQDLAPAGEGGGFYATCETHGSVEACSSARVAIEAAEEPDGFCDECRAIRNRYYFGPG